MTRVVRCERCGRLYQYLARSTCSECLTSLDREFEAVRDYLRENPGASVEATFEATGVETGTIVRFVEEGRLKRRSRAREEALEAITRRERLTAKLRSEAAERARAEEPAAEDPRPARPTGNKGSRMATRVSRR